MDATTARLVDYALAMDYAALSPHVVHECKRRLIDTLGCALGAYDEPLSVMARAVASRSQGDPSARIWGGRGASTAEIAAFGNGGMLRLMDITDPYLGKARGHPNEVTAALPPPTNVPQAERPPGESGQNPLL